MRESRRGSGPATVGTVALALVLAAAGCTDRSGQAQENGTEADTAAEAGSSVIPSDPSVVVERADRARVMGAEDAPIRLVEISDFQCPYCARYFQETFPAVDSLYIQTGKVRYVWVSYPNPGHPLAWPAIEAAYCAGAAGRFWPMHDLLFERQSEWGEAEAPAEVFVDYARELGIDVPSFEACIENDRVAPLQVRDYQNSVRAGINSTPFFVLADSVAIRGAAPISSFRSAIDTLLSLRGEAGDAGGESGGGSDAEGGSDGSGSTDAPDAGEDPSGAESG